MSGPEAIGVGARSGAARASAGSRPAAAHGSAGASAPATAAGKLAEQVYETLKAQIHDFRLVAGDRFSEAELGQRLGMSRTPVREALFRLRNEGFLGVEPKLGWYVLPIDFERLEQLYDLRVVLELASVARLCTQAATPPALEALKAVWLVPPAERLGDARSVGAHDEQFHATLVRAAGNAEMARVHWDVTERIRIIRRLDFTSQDRVKATYSEHAQILRKILRRKGDDAVMLMRSHIETSKSEVRKITLHRLHSVRAKVALR